MGVGVWGLGFGVWGLGFGVWGLGFRACFPRVSENRGTLFFMTKDYTTGP